MNPNPQQLLVVEHFEGPCVVLSVPGSGKTASVTERTKRLVARGVDPKTILAITFTNKAAMEMKERIAKAVGPEVASKITISTFHSLCSRIIRANCTALGLNKNYTIYDSDDQERLLKTCIKKIEEIGSAKFKPTNKYMNSLMGFIEGKRNEILTDEAAAEKYNLDGNQPKVAQEYFEQLRKSNAVDFTGLLSETIRLFKEHPEIRDVYRSRFRYISVDEVQDTNSAQYQFVKDIGLGHKNVLIVGDSDQSLFSWRGARPENLSLFEKEFAPCKILKLEQNYRSTPSILKYSQNLIEHNQLRKGTKLMTENKDGPAPFIRAGLNDLDMARLIAEQVHSQITAGVKPKEIAILYRTNYASRVLENALRDKQIRYKIIGGLSFWDRKEVKAGLAILKLISNENDRMAFEKVCEFCCRGVGDKAIGVVTELSQTRGLTIMQAAETYASGSTAAAKGLATLTNAMKEVSAVTPGQALLRIAHATSFWHRLEEDSTDTNDRCGNINEMARDADEYCSKPKSSLAGYLQNISLITSNDEDTDEASLIKLMTLHGSKGLEFEVVCISHCNSEMLPHSRIAIEAKNDQELLQGEEEERRLLYVGMTRAKRVLGIYFAASKLNPKGQAISLFPSKFLDETGIKSFDLEKYRFGIEQKP